MTLRFRVVALLAVAAIAAGACSNGGSATPTAGPSVKVVATVPADQLVVSGKLSICSDIPYPPQEYFNDAGDPTGSDIDLGGEIARRLGLKAAIENTVFDTIAAALAGNKCDIIMSAYDIRPDRLKEMTMIPYFKSGQSLVVAKGNPQKINSTDDMCGKSVGVESGTSEQDHVNGTGSYKPEEGLNAKCQAAGKAKIDLQPFAKDSDALLALQTNKVAAYFTDTPVAGFYVKKQSDQFEVAPFNAQAVTQGIAVSKDKTGLSDGVKKALQSMIDDGTYKTILGKYGLEDDAVSSTDVQP